MPYSSAADIPPNVKKNLKTEHEARIWLAAWNAADKSGDYDEQQAFAIAMAAVEKFRKRHGSKG